MANFIDLAVFENLSNLEIWGGEYYSSNMFFLLETMGHNLTCLHLCHVEQLSSQSLLHLASHCRGLREIRLESCSWELFDIENTNEENLENEERKDFKMLLGLTILNFIPRELLILLVSRAPNLKYLNLDGEENIDNEIIETILKKNKLLNFENLLVYNSR